MARSRERTVRGVKANAPATRRSGGETLVTGTEYVPLGSRIAAPFVRSIAHDTERLLGEVSPLIPKAHPREAKRAADLSKQIFATDSAAFVLLDQGHPMRALRLALDARGLIPAVRQNVAEERAFR